MITDEQVKITANVLAIPLSAILMRKALEAYEASKLDKINQQKDNYPKS